MLWLNVINENENSIVSYNFLWKRIKVNAKIISIKIENSRWKQWSHKLVPWKDNKIGTPLAKVTEEKQKDDFYLFYTN